MTNQRRKVGAKQRFRLFFNEKARQSAAGSLKKASWMVGSASVAAYIGWADKSVWFLVLVSVVWLFLQIVAHLILSLEERGTQRKVSEKR